MPEDRAEDLAEGDPLSRIFGSRRCKEQVAAEDVGQFLTELTFVPKRAECSALPAKDKRACSGAGEKGYCIRVSITCFLKKH